MEDLPNCRMAAEQEYGSLTNEASDILMFMNFAILRGLRESKAI